MSLIKKMIHLALLLQEKFAKLQEKLLELILLALEEQNKKKDILNRLSPLVLYTKTHENTHRNTRRPCGIVGTREGCKLSIKGMKSLGYIHVCELDPSLTGNQMVNYLNENCFEDVQCVKLKSRRPDEYSCFRISVPREEIELSILF
ncbi:hypothetical protein WA026_022361 [Henosepilachna vigintioctopunctata]|uniref:Uncharacterized protein n=1 Tax=Henosepilachna vigintioctopunctata TaxID=420089 RepID=A0AAW1UVC2_9CUCU